MKGDQPPYAFQPTSHVPKRWGRALRPVPSPQASFLYSDKPPGSFPSLHSTSSLSYLPPAHMAGPSSPNPCEEIKVLGALKRGFPLLNTTQAVGTPRSRDPGSGTLQWGEDEVERGAPRSSQRPIPTPTPGPCGNPGRGVARGTLQAVATAAAGLTPLASILTYSGDPISPPLPPTPWSAPGRAKPSAAGALPGAGLRRGRTGPARPRDGSRARVGAEEGGKKRWRPP